MDEVKMTLRIPKELHQRLARLAERQHDSINGLCATAIEEYVFAQVLKWSRMDEQMAELDRKVGD